MIHRLIHPSAHSASAHGFTIGTPRWYDLSVDILSLGQRRAAFSRLIRAAGVSPGERVLDVGCGTGYLARMLANAVGSGGLVVGIDAAPEMVSYASRRARPHTRFEVGAAESLGFADASFDVVVSTLVMHHLPSDLRARALNEIRRVLTPGGRVLIGDFQMPRSPLQRLVVKVMGLESMARHVPPLEPLAADAGFERVRSGEAAEWLRYVHAYTSADARVAR